MQGLAKELIRQGHQPTVMVPAVGQQARWRIDDVGGVEVLRLKAPRSKDVGYARRAIAEFLLPNAMRRGLAQSSLAETRWDGVVWYSPTIFFSPLIRWLKEINDCRSYLILRDLFPDWAVDTGVMRRGPAYYLLKMVERSQYEAADVIGVQSPANLEHLKGWDDDGLRQVEVLHNWLAELQELPDRELPLFDNLKGKTVFVYAGNMGRAQGMDCMIELAEALAAHDDVVFLFMGRGSEVPRLRQLVQDRTLDNVVFHDEVEPCEVPGVLRHCDVGLLALDTRHTTHNIPGKFLAYLDAGLPVLARVNPGNDIVEMINQHSVGLVSTGESPKDLRLGADKLIVDEALRRDMGNRGRRLAETEFRVERAAAQIVAGLTGADPA